ncbi:hypothetical protein BN946_scf185042.g138 [Trametes cinnabarina]|uniref:F-box domain-containing protein n=1 Tax=Pycnoporus cinnabarinus TaxID=5643 RepID=A0A060S4X9_PYCCI|nr:hypothetical protein BN946_scf185042.g138 [Trametes cinnabarina]
MLSQPGLRTFHANEFLRTDESFEFADFTVAPLTCYRQTVEDYRRHRYSIPDSALLCFVVVQSQVQQSLETLEVPSEIVPVDLLAQFCWPRLKRVSLRGENWDYHKLLVDILAQMPALEELVLTLAHRVGSDLVRLCPPDWAGSDLPWPQLKALVVTHPARDDPLYARLPSSLCRLTLRCWPRHYLYPDSTIRDFGWDSPVLSFFDMANILRQCPSNHLDTLEIEFVGDQADIELFRLISRAFPNLSSLTVFRYRPVGVVETPENAIGEALRPLSRLKYLYLHLDYPDAPDLLEAHLLPTNVVREQHARIRRIFEQSATRITHSLGSSLTIVSFLLRGPSLNDWYPFRVERTSDGRVVSVRSDPLALIRCGLTDSDDQAPMIQVTGAT